MNNVEEKRRKPGDSPVKEHVEEAREEIEQSGDEVDIASDDSFPASDPPSHTPIRGEKKKN